MNTSNNTAVPFMGHYLEKKPEAEDLKIRVKAYVDLPGSTLSFGFSFSQTEFIQEDDDSPGKEELYYFLIESGIEEYEAQFMIIDLILLACDVINSVDDELRGVLTLVLTVLVRPVEAGSEPNPGSTEATTNKDGGALFTPVELNRAGSGRATKDVKDGGGF